MSKGRGSSISAPDTSILSNIGAKQGNLSDQLFNFAKGVYDYGVQRTGQYVDPLLAQMMGVLGLGSEYKPDVYGMKSGGWGYPNEKRVSPFESNLFQLPAFAASQSADAAKKNIAGMDAIGPIQKSILTGNVDIQKMQQLQTGTLSTVSDMLSRVLNATQGAYGQGLSGALGAYGLANQALSGYSQTQGTVAGLQMQTEALRTQAEASGNMAMATGLKGLMQLGGLIGGAMIGGPAGATAGGAAGGAVGSVTPSLVGISNAYSPSGWGSWAGAF